MTNEGIVTKLLPHGMAEVAVTRASACGSSCSSCETCMYANGVKAAAKNLVSAKPGQKVVIETKSSVVFGAAMLVYVMPLILFIIGYAIAYSLGASEGLCVGISFLTLLVSGAVLITYQRKRKNKKIDYNIVEICEE